MGDGQKIRIRQDIWLPSGKFFGPANQDEPRVMADLIDHESHEWDTQRVNNLFEEDVAKEILAETFLPVCSIKPV